MDQRLVFAFIGLGAFAIGVVLPVVTMLLEKRLVWPYGTPKDTHSVIDPRDYGAKTVSLAIERGFTFLGWADDAKGGTYRISYAMLVSPDRRTLACVGIGTLAKMRVAGTVLYSFSADGQRGWLSTDNAAATEPDVLGQWVTRLEPNKHFPILLGSHDIWLSRVHAGDFLLFPPGEELITLAEGRRTRYQRMAAAGMIRFLDAERTTWRYTLPGAMRVKRAYRKLHKGDPA